MKFPSPLTYQGTSLLLRDCTEVCQA